MRKISSIILIIFILLGLSSCLKSEGEICDEKMNVFISAVESKDCNSVKSLFSEYNQLKFKVLDGRIDELFSYYSGSHTSIKRENGIISDEIINHGKSSNTIDFTYFVETNTSKYHFAFKWCIKDDFDSSNIGIKYLYIIKDSEKLDTEPYDGDLSFTDGLYIGLNSKKILINDFCGKLTSGNSSAIKDDFSLKLKSDSLLDEKLSDLISRIDSKQLTIASLDIDYTNDYLAKEYYDLYFIVFDDTAHTYFIVIRENLNGNEDILGIDSIYFKEIGVEEMLEDLKETISIKEGITIE